MRRLLSLLSSIAFIRLLFAGCQPARRIPSDRYLLNRVEIRVTGREIKQSDLRPHLKQAPNKRVLGGRFHLWLYNRSNPSKETRFQRGLRSVGEAPVLWSEDLTHKSSAQLLHFLETKGYYSATVNDTTRLRPRRAVVRYLVNPAEAHRLGRITRSVSDSSLRKVILRDTLHSLLRPGLPFDHDLLQRERDRIEKLLRNRGYFEFTSDYIFFQIDTSSTPLVANLELVVGNVRKLDGAGRPIAAPHRQYTVGKVMVDALGDRFLNATQVPFDTLLYNRIAFVLKQPPYVGPVALNRAVQLRPDSLYSLLDEENTYRNLIGLRSFKLVNIQYSLLDPATPSQAPDRLHCQIQVTPFKKQSLSAETEATYSQGDYGGGVTLNYQNRSLFRNAEILDLRTKIASESFASRGEGRFKGSSEYSIEGSITLPKLMLPGGVERRVRYTAPKTTFSAGYNYLQRPEYRRSVANLSMNFGWRVGRNWTYYYKPFDFYYVDSDLSDTYRNRIRGMYIEKSYIPHTILAASTGFLFSTQPRSPGGNYLQLRFNLESAGALQSAAFSLWGSSRNEFPHSMFGSPWAQYIKTDIDFRLHQPLGGVSEGSKLVYRFFAGVGRPYDNSNVLPFQKQYYSGGAFGLRGWRIRSLGPGSYRDTSAYNNSTGDIRLEFNVEHRFKLFWILHGALFMDAGDIWNFTRDPLRPGADFAWDRFYKEIALNGGAGLRFDFSFVVGRIDIGVKGRDPIEGWIWGNRPVTWDDFAFNFGIGYPF